MAWILFGLEVVNIEFACNIVKIISKCNGGSGGGGVGILTLWIS